MDVLAKSVITLKAQLYSSLIARAVVAELQSAMMIVHISLPSRIEFCLSQFATHCNHLSSAHSHRYQEHLQWVSRRSPG